MKIIINGNHTEKLAAALDTAQRRCTARTLTVHDVERVLEDTTARMGISRAAMNGTKLHYTGGEKFPLAYRYRPESTHFEAEHNGRYWCITFVYRTTCPNSYNNTKLILSDSARAAILSKLDCFTI